MLAQTIMVVDDEKMVTTTLSTLIKMMLKGQVLSYNCPEEALHCERLQNKQVDLIISDFMMPGMNGLEFLKAVRIKHPECITILLTGYADKENAIRSINEIGLYYYLEKPWDNTSLVTIIKNGLEKKALSDSLRMKFVELETSNREIARLYDMLQKDYSMEVDNIKNLVISLAYLIEAKDVYTEGHTRRVGTISRMLGARKGLTGEELDYLEISGIIHDIGKVGVSEVILNKPGKLSEEEFELIKKHTVTGDLICRPLNCLQPCRDGIRHHHEKLNGKGYPDGLQGAEISIAARILGIADIFDALYSKRPYREKLPIEKVREIMFEDAKNGALDMSLVELLFAMVDAGEMNTLA